MKILKLFTIIILFILVSGNFLFSQEQKKPLTRILLILDASNSMTGIWDNKVKMNTARAVLGSMVDSLSKIENVQLALRVYGHQSPIPPQDCKDTKLEVPFKDNNAAQIRMVLNFIKPKGTTPIANSLEACADDFPECDNCRNIVILVTDGIEACDGDPCAISLALQKKGIILKPFVIGIGLDVDLTDAFACIGNYFNASSAENFSQAINDVIYQTLTQTTMQVNLNDINGKPVETNVNLTFFNETSGRVVHNFIHTLNVNGNPDTIILDPVIDYKIVVNTIPPVYSNSFKLEPGKHTTVNIDVPQGSLIIESPVTNNYNSINYIVRQSGSNKTINVPFINSKDRYITGKYDLEVLTLPRLYFTNVEIQPNETTSIKIPQVGIVIFLRKNNGFGSIYKLNEDGSQEWLANLNPELTKESIYLLPGEYLAVFRDKLSKNTGNSYSTTFKCVPGSTNSVVLYK